MYNFLDPKLLPKVVSNSPATDNFEVTNLINQNEAVRARGYLAYTVIRPPVELEFEFLCPVDISYITINTTVGRQKCTGIELFAKNSTSLYCSIGKAVFDKEGVIFCTSKRYSKSNPPSDFNENRDLFFFKINELRVFTDTNSLKIVIFRTERRSVPCLGSIKVFGIPGRSCTPATKETIAKLMGLTPRPTLQPDNQSSSSEFTIPPDFIDDLTCEIMAIPMTLPSGKTIDRDTLEKHTENEQSFGRKPGDPFTGLKFTESRKPIINSALKSRIDMFLLQNSNNPVTYNLKRTLGFGDSNTDLKRIKLDGRNCCVCNGNNILYVIPCGHFYCRNCLLGLVIIKCGSCEQEFSKNQAIRCHA